jgi:carbamoyltransferase
LVAAASEERFDRTKHSEAVPLAAIRYCLESARIRPAKIDILAFGLDPAKAFHWFCNECPNRFSASHSFVLEMCDWTLRNLDAVHSIGQAFQGTKELRFIDHHLCHAYHAFVMSGFRQSAILTVDGYGDMESTVLWTVDRSGYRKVAFAAFPHSLGYLFGGFTKFLGFRPDFDEGTVMALAARGKPRYFPKVMNLITFDRDSLYRLDLTAFPFLTGEGSLWGDCFPRLFGPPRKPGARLTANHFDIAASVQMALEETLLQILAHPALKSMKNLCLAGGVALNCAANGVIRRKARFREVFVPPAAGDDGIALGAAFAAHFEHASEPPDITCGALLGPQFSNEEIATALVGNRFETCSKPALCQRVASLMEQGAVGGWFQGRMEFGARALGNRSILADCRSASVRDRLNAKIKNREPFRPFAPAVAEEAAGEYFDIHTSPFMSLAVSVRPAWKEKLAGVTHADGTARVQTVSASSQPLFHRLLKTLRSKTGFPIVLNTSFNGRDEPIVCTPREALATYHKLRLDFLAIGKHLLIR